jgi:hypothetical protein
VYSLFLDSGYTCSHKDTTDAKREKKGCTGTLKSSQEICGIKFHECPRKAFCKSNETSSLILEILDAHGDYRQHGILPDGGGKKDQSSVLLEAFKVMDQVTRECDAIREKEEKRREEGAKNRQKLLGGG